MTPKQGRILIRADAGMGIGMGHLLRCLTLARTLVARDFDVTIATRANSPSVVNRILEAGAEVLPLSGSDDHETAEEPVWSRQRQVADAREIREKLFADSLLTAVVVDHYGLDRTWEELMYKYSKRIVVIDDLANRPHSADVIVDQNWYGPGTVSRYDGLTSSETVQLLGPRYALIHHEYVSARRQREPSQIRLRRVMVSYGGTDVRGQTAKAVRALLSFPEVQIHAVLGTKRAMTDELAGLAKHPRVKLHVDLPNLAELMAQVDFVLGAGGTATWERLCMELPALVTTTSINQSGVTRALHEAHLTTWLGTADTVHVNDYISAVETHLTTPRPEVVPIVDGYGAERVGLAVVPPSKGGVKTRRATFHDSPSFVTAVPNGLCGPETWIPRSHRFLKLVAAEDAVDILEYEGVPVGVAETTAHARSIFWDTSFGDTKYERQV